MVDDVERLARSLLPLRVCEKGAAKEVFRVVDSERGLRSLIDDRAEMQLDVVFHMRYAFPSHAKNDLAVGAARVTPRSKSWAEGRLQRDVQACSCGGKSGEGCMERQALPGGGKIQARSLTSSDG
jgi:hypothetical protein